MAWTDVLASNPYGFSPDYFKRLAQVESNSNPTAQPIGKDGKPLSSAYGLFQFTNQTWSDTASQFPGLGLTDRTDPDQQAKAILALTNQSKNILTSALNRRPTSSELYMAHYLGPGTAKKVLAADPGAQLSDVVSPWVITANPWLKGKTIGDFRGWVQGKFENKENPMLADTFYGSGVLADELDPRDTNAQQYDDLGPLAAYGWRDE